MKDQVTKHGETFDNASMQRSMHDMTRMLGREAQALREHRQLFRILDQLVQKPSLESALEELASVTVKLFGTQSSVVVASLQSSQGRRLIAQAGKLEVRDSDFDVPFDYMKRPRRVVDASVLGAGIAGRGIKSAMMVPLDLPGKENLALVCMKETAMGFTHADFRRLQTIAKVAAQPLANLLLTHRNEKLATLILGKEELDEALPKEAGADLPFKAVSHAMGRLTHAQEMLVDVLNDILTARGIDLDHRLADSLARICANTGADRAVIGLLGPMQEMHREISWSAPDFVETPDLDHAYWNEVVPFVKTHLSMGQPAIMTRQHDDPGCVLQRVGCFESVALFPIMDDGLLIGVLGVDHVSAPHFFVQGMVYLLQSVAHAIGSVYRQSRIEAQSAEAQSSLWLERMRLKATLSALPDLVLEVDDSGRFVTHHSRQNPQMVTIMERLLGRSFEEALPDHLAALGRYMLDEVSLRGRSECAPFQFELSDGDTRWIKATAVRRDGKLHKSEDPSVTLFVLRDVTTEVTQAEEISRLSQVARRTQSLVIMTDADRKVTWVNEAFERATGWTLKEIIGKSPKDFLLAPSKSRESAASINDRLTRGLPIQQETLNITKDGRELWVSNDIQPIFDAGGVITGYIGVQLDITERREHEVALAKAAAAARESRAILLEAVEALQDGFVIYDADGKLVLCNQKYRDQYPKVSELLVPGTSRDEIFREALARGSISVPADLSESEFKDRVFGRKGSAAVYEYQLEDGRWMHAYNKQTQAGSWVGLRVDITSLKAAEASAVSDRKAAMEAAKDGMVTIASTGEILFANQAFIDMFDLHGECPIDGKLWTDLLGPSFASSIAGRALPALQSGATNWHEIIPFSRNTDKSQPMEVSITMGSDRSFVWVIRDVSERQRHEEERVKLMEELQLAQRREVIGQLAAGLAHDFNNLLAAISGSALLIKEDQPHHSSDWNHAERILKSTGQAEAMVRRLLALGARPEHHQKVNLAPLLREAAEMLRPALSRSIKLRIDAPDGSISADVESTDILQIILNLGVNARDALLSRKVNKASPEIRLELRTATRDEMMAPAIIQKGTLNHEIPHACLIVADTGDGIGPELAAKIFNSYFTTKGKKGTGLGLPIVTNMVRAAGGAISLHAAPEGGAEFRVYLPLDTTPTETSTGKAHFLNRPAKATLTDRAESSPRAQTRMEEVYHAAVTQRPKPLEGRSILLVDDADEVLDVMMAVLERAGAEVAPTSDPEAALDVLSDDPFAFDLVITDFDMGAISGADLTRSIKQLRPDMPVILITALTDWKMRDQAKANAPDPSFYAVLGKPVTKETLVGTALAAIDSTQD